MKNGLKTSLRLIAEDHNVGFTGKLARPFLGAASGVYGLGVGLIRYGHEKKIFKRHRFPFPVISVGNLTWGGAGKTPVVEYLARRIAERHRTPLILTRGYSNDEVEQMRHHLPRIVIGVGKDRVAVAKGIAAKQAINVAILDDGFQHWPIERDMDIVVVNALNPFGNGNLIPRGILREPLSVLNRASIIVLSHCNLMEAEALQALKQKLQKAAPKAALVESFLEPLFFYRANRHKRVSLSRLEHQRVTTFSGVGMPRSFQMLLSHCHIKPTRNFEFTDHHAFTDLELEEIKAISKSAATEEIVTTEKDFYRAPEQITRILNPLVLATRLRISKGEEALTDQLSRLLVGAVSRP